MYCEKTRPVNILKCTIFCIFLALSACSASTPIDHDGGEYDSDAVEDVSIGADPDADLPEIEPDADLDEDVSEDAEVESDSDRPTESRFCEPCHDDWDCHITEVCAPELIGGVCLLLVSEKFNVCPRGFYCVLDLSLGIDDIVCSPVDGPCCIDEDADQYGQGIDCLGPDCDDEDGTRHPDAEEICNGIDDDCDGEIDEPPADCSE